ncbi:MAG: class I tRNA ligase family protein, partial [Pseudohongiella sp.]|nr:class I tRNA ligase family protein [Pseudohongiella sp.]
RFLLANISDFDYATQAVPTEELLEVDQYALTLISKLQSECEAHYLKYEFHPIVSKLQIFCSEDLGAFYLDVLKDRLYTTGVNSTSRRSAQTALYHITHALLRLMAPVLSFTAEEACEVMGNVEASVFCNEFYKVPKVANAETLGSKWAELLALRARVVKELESLRTAGKIGSSLQGAVALQLPADLYSAAESLDDDLKFLFIVSSLTIAKASEENIEVGIAEGEKCERCWHVRPDTGADPEHPGVCGRCVSNLFGEGEVRNHV